MGIVYFLTHGHDRTDAPNDIARILPQDPDILRKPDSPLWGRGNSYYWGQPLYGYYNSTDPWVLRRHASSLADAGIDTVILDTYPSGDIAPDGRFNFRYATAKYQMDTSSTRLFSNE
ncbi:MAG: hypothetical protein NTW21_30300 [Verrucomicrobia bacterium]|nr:hypothetical protein [Verrucomicrobiota bacterium]